MQYSIGEFSRMTRVSVKALRLYHERGLLKPDFVDPESGYRYYTEEQFFDLRVVLELKALGFSLKDIHEILDHCEEDCDLVEELERQKHKLNARISAYRTAVENIELILKTERRTMSDTNTDERVEEKYVDEILIAGHRMKGRYDEIGNGFGKVGRKAGRWIAGPAMALYYDGEYKEEGADYEACFPVKKEVTADEINCRVIGGGKALTIVHQGPYDTLSDSYKILWDVVKANGLKLKIPSREIYLKGPGMILKGNPKKYRTEIQFFVEE